MFRKVFLYLEEIGLLDRITTYTDKEKAINQGYWCNNPGDNHVETASDPTYGQEDGQLPPLDELADDPENSDYTKYNSKDDEKAAGLFVNDDDEIVEGKEYFSQCGFDWEREDNNWGIDIYCEAVTQMES
ncbi:hypothetical protein K435DRAFT_880109 [Dendrothele bispora CBS 962.96]|uniref:Uncharacterized protein n=1 Tax=Dendrothele bispora (strain CBS 962.96) TaxID=1314807 RepID=A0A4S8KK20_DENBC|nr:hypothetical protein K435DRAFT_880109 [Dendrothele bispora CBS 962.96]